MGKSKYILLFSIAALILIGLSYALSTQLGFKDTSLANASLIEFLPEECKVLETSRGVTASIEFNCDAFGNITDKTYVKLIAKDIYAGANSTFSITAQNISNIPLTIDMYKLYIDDNNRSLADLIYFSGKVKIYRNNGEYYDTLGTFDRIRLPDLADHLTSIMKYRKIDMTEKLVLELDQQFDKDQDMFTGKSGLSYRLIPVFVQYFPKNADSRIAEK